MAKKAGAGGTLKSGLPAKKKFPLSQIPLFHAGLPVYLLSSCSERGTPNVAPFAQVLCTDYRPPRYCIVFDPGSTSLRNVRKTKECVLNIATRALASAIAVTSQSFPPEVNKFAQAKLTPIPSLAVQAPSVGESPAHIECRAEKFTTLPSRQVLLAARTVALRGDPKWLSQPLWRQKRALSPLYAFRPSRRDIPLFLLGRYLGSI